MLNSEYTLHLCVLIVLVSALLSQAIEPNSAKVRLVCKKIETFSQITTVMLRLQSTDNDKESKGDYHYKNITCDGKDADFQFNSLTKNHQYVIFFCLGWRKHYSALPNNGVLYS